MCFWQPLRIMRGGKNLSLKTLIWNMWKGRWLVYKWDFSVVLLSLFTDYLTIHVPFTAWTLVSLLQPLIMCLCILHFFSLQSFTLSLFFPEQDVPHLSLSFLSLPSSPSLTPGSRPDSWQTTLPVWLRFFFFFFLHLFSTCNVHTHIQTHVHMYTLTHFLYRSLNPVQYLVFVWGP